jgi:hypothetical protein
MIPAGYTELHNAFRGHIRVADTGTEDSHYLLFFYGLECGLKSIYLKRNKILRPDQTSNENFRSTHDLSLLIKDLRLPAQVTGAALPSFRLERDGTSLPIKRAHEIWRYGIIIQPDDEKKLVAWMHAIRSWIKETI